MVLCHRNMWICTARVENLNVITSFCMFGWNQGFEYFFVITSTHHHQHYHHHLPCTTTTCHIQTPFTMYNLTPPNYIQQQSHTTTTMYNRYNLPCTNNNTYRVPLLLPTHITTVYKSHLPSTSMGQTPPIIYKHHHVSSEPHPPCTTSAASTT